MEENFSNEQYANRVAKVINSVTTEAYFENVTDGPGYEASNEKAKEALLYVRNFFASLRYVDLKSLYRNELEGLYEDLQQFDRLLTNEPVGTIQTTVIELANRISSQRLGPIAYALAKQDGLSEVYKSAAQRLQDQFQSAQQTLNEVGNVQETALRANQEQLESLIKTRELLKDIEAQSVQLQFKIKILEEDVTNDFSTFKNGLFETANDQQREWLEALRTDTEADLEGIKKPLRDISSAEVAKLNALAFHREATAHNVWSFVWLFISAALLVGLGYMGLRFNSEIATAAPQEVGNAIEATAFRVLLFSLGTFALVFSTRTYSSHRHNFVINRHRRNALATFQTFANGSDDSQVRNAILLQAATCIFSPQVSGYVRNESDTVTNTPVVNLIENLTKQP